MKNLLLLLVAFLFFCQNSLSLYIEVCKANGTLNTITLVKKSTKEDNTNEDDKDDFSKENKEENEKTEKTEKEDNEEKVKEPTSVCDALNFSLSNIIYGKSTNKAFVFTGLIPTPVHYTVLAPPPDWA